MPIPQINEILHPFMFNLAKLKECSIRNMTEQMAIHFSLSEKEKGEILPSGKETILRNRVGWARTFLKKAGLADSPIRGYVSITQEGLQAVSLNRTIDIDYLETIPSFVEFRNRRPKRHNKGKQQVEVTPPKKSMASQNNRPDATSDNFKLLLAKLPEFNPNWSEKAIENWLEVFRRVSEKA